MIHIVQRGGKLKNANKNLKILSVIILILTILRIVIDSYNFFMISITDATVLDTAIKVMVLNSYKRAFLQHFSNLLYSIIGIMAANKKIHKKIALGAGILSMLLCIVLQFYEFAILSFIMSIVPLVLYIYFVWKSDSKCS